MTKLEHMFHYVKPSKLNIRTSHHHTTTGGHQDQDRQTDRVWQLLPAKKSAYLAACQQPLVQLWRLPSLCWWSWSCGWPSLHQPLKELPENRVKHAKYVTSFSLYMLLLAFTIIDKHGSRILLWFVNVAKNHGGRSLATQSSKAL